MPDPRSFESEDQSRWTAEDSKVWVVVASALQLGLIALVWLLVLVPTSLAVLCIVFARRIGRVWRRLSSRAGR